MSEELRPCPFCGEMPKVHDWKLKGITDKRCFCDNENCPVYLSKTIAIDDWNTRPIEDALTARIAELEAENAELKERVARFKKKNKKLKASVKVAAQKSTYWDHQNCKCSVVYTRAEEGEK